MQPKDSITNENQENILKKYHIFIKNYMHIDNIKLL